MHPNLPTPASKEAERQRLAGLFDLHLDNGGAIHVLPGFKPAPLPPRRKRIDPETVLKRRRPKPKTSTEPQTPRAAPATAEAAAPEFVAIVDGLRTLAAAGTSLMAAARQLGISETKARWHAKRNGILFAKPNMPKLSDEALAALARQHADRGETLNMAAKSLSCGADRLRRLADLHGIEFRSGRRWA